MAAIRCCRISISKRSSCCSCTCCDDFYTRERPPSSSRSTQFCHFMPSSSSVINFNFNFNFIPSSLHRLSPTPRRRRVTYVSCLQAKSSNSPPLFRQQLSQREDDHEYLSEGSVSVTGGIVALGKFDALHIGHRELAIQASKVGIPFLLSFVGMAEVLGWELRAPIVAKCDRKRVLSSWSAYCGSIPPAECHVEFSSVRHLSPREFVEKLAKELGVRGVVAGENYRFGYKAAGDASELVKLCDEYGIGAYIVGSVMDKHQPPRVGSSLDAKDKGQVSSTRVRCALAEGDIKYVSELLGRVHRLILMLSEQEGFTWQGNRISIPKSCLLNLPPKEGLYENCRCIIGDTLVIPCTTVIDTTHIHIESNQQIPFQEYRVIGIEFGAEGDC